MIVRDYRFCPGAFYHLSIYPQQLNLVFWAMTNNNTYSQISHLVQESYLAVNFTQHVTAIPS